jgi:transposase-like protein
MSASLHWRRIDLSLSRWFALRVRSAGKVVSVPVLGVVGVLSDGGKQLLVLDLCSGESFAASKGCLDDVTARGLRAPVLCIIDGMPACAAP